jgi:hypothetical protein
MAKFNETDAGEKFIASGESRETSIEIMQAIAFFARDMAEAEALWEGAGIGAVAHLLDIWENATGNGAADDTEIMWGGRTLAEIMAEDVKP